MMRTMTTKEDGTVDIRLAPRTIGNTYFGEPPSKDDLEAFLYPLYGGGEYIVINQSTKKVHK